MKLFAFPPFVLQWCQCCLICHIWIKIILLSLLLV